MKIFVVGGTGFIGRNLLPALLHENHEIYALIRPGSKAALPPGVRSVQGDARYGGEWQAELAGKDAVINLAGIPVIPPWTLKKKEAIYQSRIETTHNVVAALSPGQLLVNASAIGYYGFRDDDFLLEDAQSGEGFLASVCRDWEAKAASAVLREADVVITRLGVVLGYGGALEDLARVSQKYVGSSRLGSGKQWFSWIHIEDAIQAVLFCMEHRNSSSEIYNVCSPNPVQNRELMQTLARLFDRSVALPIPAALIKLAVGEFADVVLKGQRVYPGKLLAKGFEFRYPSLPEALKHLLWTPGKF